MILAPSGAPRAAPRKVSGSSSLAMVPPGEWFSKKPVPALIAGTTLSKYSSKYCGAATSHSPRPAIAAAASIDQRRAHSTSRPTGAWISFKATAIPRAAPPHQRPATQARSHAPESASSTRLI